MNATDSICIYLCIVYLHFLHSVYIYIYIYTCFDFISLISISYIKVPEVPVSNARVICKRKLGPTTNYLKDRESKQLIDTLLFCWNIYTKLTLKVNRFCVWSNNEPTTIVSSLQRLIISTISWLGVQWRIIMCVALYLFIFLGVSCNIPTTTKALENSNNTSVGLWPLSVSRFFAFQTIK